MQALRKGARMYVPSKTDQSRIVECTSTWTCLLMCGTKYTAIKSTHGSHIVVADEDTETPQSVFTMSTLEAQTPARANWANGREFFLSLVGLAVGIGNVWRFPYVCYNNGGGAFLIPYFIILFLCGKPLFFMELSLGQYCSLGPWTLFRRLTPLSGGIGIAMILMNIIVLCYYNVLVSYSIYYMMVTLRAVVLHEPLPWSWCDPQWANSDCFDRSSLNESFTMNGTSEDGWTMLSSMSNNVSWLFVNETSVDSVHSVNTSRQQPSPEQYFENQVLQIRVNGTEYAIDHLGGIVWQLAVCVLACWTMVCLGLIKGVESAGKVVYVTATLPYVILFALMIRGATLDGAKEGMIFLFTPQWAKLWDITTWRNAASQCFYGISVTNGSLITFGSYNPFRRKVAKDALAVCILDTVASLMACVGIFAVLGHLSLQLGVPIESVSKGGQGLAFAVYPEALQLLPAPHLWAVLFFLMLFSLGIDSLFGCVEPILTSLFDQFPLQRQHKAKWTIGFCAAFFLLTLPCVTHGGLYVIDLLDTYGGGISLLIIATSESLAVFWMYGVDRLAQDFLFMMAYKSSVILKICWKYITPILIACILMASLVTHQPISASGKPYPAWADSLGWTMVFAIVLPIPIWATCVIVHRLLLRHHKESIKPILDGLMGPGAKWGPADDVVWQEREQFRLSAASELKKSTDTGDNSNESVSKF